MTKFVKKPIVIDAFIWTGNIKQTEDPHWIRKAMDKDNVWVTKSPENGTCQLAIRTLEGVMLANQGDFIIRGIEGEIYPCKPGIFTATYDRVDAIPAPQRHRISISSVPCHASFFKLHADGENYICKASLFEYEVGDTVTPRAVHRAIARLVKELSA